ncbi:MAG: hypothetical protein ACO32I_06720, partial [Candidatus Limnocylindrus sp.]
EMARDLIRDSVIEDAIAQKIAQIIEFIHEDRIKPLESKLAKAVEALDRIAGKAPYADDPYDIARAALAELKGDKT